MPLCVNCTCGFIWNGIITLLPVSHLFQEVISMYCELNKKYY